MFRKNPQLNEQLDRFGAIVLRSAAQNDREAEAAAGSPFLFTRVRASIAAEQRQQTESGGWLSLFFVARQAVPAMALIAFLAALLLVWSFQASTPAAWQRLDDEALSDTRDPGVEQTVLSRNNLSREEVFNIVVDRNDQEKR